MIAEIKRIKKLMQINEEFISVVDDDFIERPYSNVIFLAKNPDDKIHHYLLLFVALEPTMDRKNYFYSYGFTIHSENWSLAVEPIFTRDEANKYLPVDLRGSIIPLVLKMTKNLVERINPPKIIRETVEKLSGNSLQRYDKITDLLVNVLRYKIESSGTTSNGKNYWIMVNTDGETMTVDESYELNDSEKKWIAISESIRADLTPEVVKMIVEHSYKNKEIKNNRR